MDCEQIRHLLAGFADGEVTTLEAAIVEQHVAACGRCRQVLHGQQQVKHVLGSYEPPPVEKRRWEAVGETLRAELAGTGDPVVLKTRPHVEGLDATPQELEAMEEVSAAEAEVERALGSDAERGDAGEAEKAPERPRRRRPAAREPAEPVPRKAPPAPSPRVVQRRPPAISVLAAKPSRHRQGSTRRVGWGAHAVGALAAALILAVCFMAAVTYREAAAMEPIDFGDLARQGDVEFHAVEVLDPHYDIVFCGGNTDDLAGVFVVYRDDETPIGNEG